MDDIRQRFLRDRIMTATPVQRVVMLYDRLSLDLARARAVEAPADARPHLVHATQIVAELLGSLDHAVTDSPAENLAQLYNYLLRELLVAQTSADHGRLETVETIVTELGAAWTRIASGDVPAGRTGPSATSMPAVGTHVPMLTGTWTA